MTWNPLEKLWEKFKPSSSKKEPASPASAEVLEALKGGGTPDLKELEKKGLLGQFFRHWKNPAFTQQVQALTERMKADGVNLKDKAAVQTWLESHKKDLESGQMPTAPKQSATYVKTGPNLGRNDPCSCGSGKKFKKCCGNK